ncbi:MAG: trypsin-like peptidase domain-containing protein [Gemmatimonadetes bacterium]|nr:trypsin-like peptidase domain-containing protein [Gemmatimonadota bacterium]
MSVKLKSVRIFAIATVAFVGSIVFASSMDWTQLLVAQPKAGAPVVNMAAPGRGDVQGGFAEIAAQVTPAVVSIQAERDARPSADNRRNGRGRVPNLPPGFEQFFGPDDPQNGPQASSGTGFLVSKDGYVLTNNHVVADMDRIRVTLTDRRQYKARVIGRDPQTDVAVIKIEGTNLPAVTIGNDDDTRVGEWVLAIGNPLGLDFTVTAGIVSAKGRSTPSLGRLNGDTYAIQDFIQTDAAINPGNSGGPLINARGEVIGINSAIASQTGTYTGYGFAIPITLAKTVMDDIIAHGRVRRAIMGAAMNEVTAEDAAVNKLNEISGAKIQDFSVGDPASGITFKSPAETAGIERGDIVVAADGKKVDRVSTLQRILRKHQPGDVVSLDIVRYGDRKNFKVKLTEVPTAAPRAVVAETPPSEDSSSTGAAFSNIGIRVEALTARVAEARSISDKLKGVVVTAVTRGSSAEGRLFPGDVISAMRLPNRVEILTVADLQREIGKVKAGEYISLLVYRTTDFQTGATQSSVVNLLVGD